MNIWITPQDEFQQLNDVQEVTNPISFEKGMVPTADGLFSTEIFGMNTLPTSRNYATLLQKNWLIHSL